MPDNRLQVNEQDEYRVHFRETDPKSVINTRFLEEIMMIFPAGIHKGYRNGISESPHSPHHEPWFA